MAFQTILTDTSSSAEVPQERSAGHYRPMFRLFDESNFEYIIPAGYPRRARLLRRFRSERRSLFWIYLCELRADHARIVTAIRSLLIESQVDRPDLAITLYRCQFTFALTIVLYSIASSGISVGDGGPFSWPVDSCPVMPRPWPFLSFSSLPPRVSSFREPWC
jgi:hypothetical protein